MATQRRLARKIMRLSRKVELHPSALYSAVGIPSNPHSLAYISGAAAGAPRKGQSELVMLYDEAAMLAPLSRWAADSVRAHAAAVAANAPGVKEAGLADALGAIKEMRFLLDSSPERPPPIPPTLPHLGAADLDRLPLGERPCAGDVLISHPAQNGHPPPLELRPKDAGEFRSFAGTVVVMLAPDLGVVCNHHNHMSFHAPGGGPWPYPWPIRTGGPVLRRSLQSFVPDVVGAPGLALIPGVRAAGEAETREWVAAGGDAAAVTGLAVWAQDQLRAELDSRCWVVARPRTAEVTASIFFKTPHGMAGYLDAISRIPTGASHLFRAAFLPYCRPIKRSDD